MANMAAIIFTPDFLYFFIYGHRASIALTIVFSVLTLCSLFEAHRYRVGVSQN